MKSPHFTAVSPGEFFFDEPVDLRTIISYGFIWIHMVASIEILWIPMVSRCIPYCGMGIFPFFFFGGGGSAPGHEQRMSTFCRVASFPHLG